MRTRTKRSEGTYQNKSWVSTGGADRMLGTTFDQNFSSYGGHPGPNGGTYSQITDQLSPKGRYSFNPCTHIRSQGALFDNKFFYDFVAPINPAPMWYKFYYEYRPSSPQVSNPPWEGLLDDLANLVEGHHSQASMLSVTLLEGLTTLNMMRNPFSLLKPNFRRKVRKLTARRLANTSANVWLEGYYGWKSFYQDVTGAAKSLAYFLNEPSTSIFENDEVIRLSVSKTQIIAQQSTVYDCGTTVDLWNHWKAVSGFPNSNGVPVARRTNVCISENYRIGCLQFQDAFQRIQNTRRFLRLSGMANWRDIRDTIWEVIPFSFVIDWFVDQRGIWAPLNKWRLSQTDVKEVGYTVQHHQEYDVEVNLLLPFSLYYATAYPWAYKMPLGKCGDYILRSIAKGTYHYYCRTSGFPLTNLVDVKFLSHGLKRIQLLNGAALLLQRFKP